MYLNKRTYVGAEYEHRNVTGEVKIFANEKPVPVTFNRISEIIERVAYWRKANHIHNWFVQNVQSGKDNCGEYYVSKEKLKELIDLCKKVVEHKDKAAEFLPTVGGVFFGGTDYDEYYYEDTQATIDMLEPLLEEEGGDFQYTSSW